MEFCEKGSLERAVRLGKFKRSTAGHGEMVSQSNLLTVLCRSWNDNNSLK